METVGLLQFKIPQNSKMTPTNQGNGSFCPTDLCVHQAGRVLISWIIFDISPTVQYIL